jgi:hypothetical protein
MALRFGSRIDRRQAVFGMLAAGGAAALPVEAPAVPAPGSEKAYSAFFLGQGGYLLSWGIPFLEAGARKLGLATDVFSYTDLKPAWTSIVRKRKEGYKIALVGYSLGNTTATYLQRHLAVDLLLAIAESSLGRNHPIEKKNTRRSVLWYGSDMLSNAGVHDGFDETNYIETLHLMMDLDPRVVSGVLGELKSLITPARRDEPVVAANTPGPGPIAPQIDNKIVRAPAPAPGPRPGAGWLPPTNVITPDVTCTNCWGFTQSPGAAWPDDSWMR